MTKSKPQLKQEYTRRVEKLTGCIGNYEVSIGNGSVNPNGSLKENSGIKYFVRIFECHDLFIVWDCDRRREVGGTLKTYSCASSWEKIKWDDSPIIDYYKQLGNCGADKPYEKVAIVQLSFFDEFFANCEEYMSFNEFDNHFPHHDKGANAAAKNWSSPQKRKRYSTSKLSRDVLFRERVLEAYGYRCAVCGCDIPEMLQAAHEHGHTVVETDHDDPNHGVCLCANHHLMYDSELLEIDIPNRKYQCKAEMHGRKWYSTFSEKEEGRFVDRTELPAQS